MKIRDVGDGLIRRHIREGSRNRRARLRMMRAGRGTEEQLRLAEICEKLDRRFMKYDTVLYKNLTV